MRVISFNANGIRAAFRKGFFDWLAEQQADFVCIQETKAQKAQLTDPAFFPADYHCYYHDAEQKGYSGVALYARQPPERVQVGLDWPEFDCEGRYVAAHYPELTVASLYLPSGTSGAARQQIKYGFMADLMPYFQAMLADSREYVLCGDWNIAHKPIDLKNWKSNQKNSGFLPDERAWLDRLFDELGLVDAFRVVNQQADEYTWWSFRGQAWSKNVGWRIDYQIITPGLRDKVRAAWVYRDERFSDHAPLVIDYDLAL